MFRHFITHKRGETDEDIQDSIAFDLSRGRFAISDGMTLSFIPHIWSKLLVNQYVSSSDEKLVVFDGLLIQYEKAKKQFLQELDENERYFQKLAEQEFKHAKATFAGIYVNNHIVSWQIIGDSCVFIVYSSGTIRCVNKMPNDVDSNGHILMNFDNHPEYIGSDGTIKGRFVEGKDILDSGWIVMMTDALSSWFVKQHNEGKSPFETLKALTNNADFETFVEKECQAGRLKSDDTSVIFFNIPDDLVKEEKELDTFISQENDINKGEIWDFLPLWMM